MTTVSTINQIRRDILAAHEKNPHALLEAMTDHPQATLNQFTCSYGIQLLAEEELPVIFYLTIKLQQGYDLDSLLQHNPSASVRATLFTHGNTPREIATAEATDTSRLINK